MSGARVDDGAEDKNIRFIVVRPTKVDRSVSGNPGRLQGPMRTAALILVVICSLAGGAAEAGAKKKGGGRAFLQIAPMVATVLRPDGRRGVLTVEAGVDAKDDALHAKAQASLPRLRAAYAAVIQNHAAGLGPGSAPNADRLAGDLQRETDRVLGGPGGRLLLGTLIIN